MERKFLVLLRRFRLQNEHLYYIICGSLALFISPSLRGWLPQLFQILGKSCIVI